MSQIRKPRPAGLPKDPQRAAQVRTFIERYGRSYYAQIGSRDGRASPASFNSERAKLAAAKSLEVRRLKKIEKEKRREKRNQTTSKQN